MAVIPGPRGFAGLATWAAFVRSPQTMLMGLHRRHGKVCALGLGRLHYTCLFGAEANRYLLIDHADQFTAREANQVLTLTDGHTAVTVSDGDDHKRRRRVLLPAFRKQVIDAYLSHMIAGLDRLLASLRVGDEIDLYVPLRRVVAEVALQAL